MNDSGNSSLQLNREHKRESKKEEERKKGLFRQGADFPLKEYKQERFNFLSF